MNEQTADNPANRPPLALLGCGLVWLAFLAHSSSLANGFVWDDAKLIWDNPITKSTDGWLQSWTSLQRMDYYPLTSIVFWVLHEVFGRQLVYYHLTCIALHACCVVLLWRVLVDLKFKGAWLTAAIFAVHPVTVASVAWLSQIKNTLSMVFYLASLLYFLRHDEKRSYAAFAFSLVLFVCTCLSKASTVVLPAAMVICLFWRHGSDNKKRFLWTLPYFLIAFAACIVHIHFQHHYAIGDISSAEKVPLLQRVTSIGWIVWFYIYKGILPTDLSMLYPRWNISFAKVLHQLPNALLLATFAVAWWKRRTVAGRAILFWLSYLIIALSPVMGLVQMAFQRLSLVSDHLQYIALPATAALIATGIVAARAKLKNHKHVIDLTAVGLVVLFACISVWYATTFSSLETMWRHNAKTYPQVSHAHVNLGLALQSRDAHEDALKSFEKALELQPDRAQTLMHAAVSLAKLKQYERAKQKLKLAIEHDPALAGAYEVLGGIHLLSNDLEQAVVSYHRAIELGQKTGKSEHGLALISEATGNKAMAAHWYARAVKQSPKSLVYRKGLANALLSTDSIDKAWPHMVFIARHDMRPEGAVSLAMQAKAKGHVQRAAALLAMCQSRHPSDAQVSEQLALCFIAEQRYASAASQCSRAYHLYPTRFASAFGLGISATKAGYLAVAELAYRRAMKLDASHRGVRNELAIVLASQGKLQAAANLLEQTLEQYPDDEDTKGNLEQVRTMLNRSPK